MSLSSQNLSSAFLSVQELLFAQQICLQLRHSDSAIGTATPRLRDAVSAIPILRLPLRLPLRDSHPVTKAKYFAVSFLPNQRKITFFRSQKSSSVGFLWPSAWSRTTQMVVRKREKHLPYLMRNSHRVRKFYLQLGFVLRQYWHRLQQQQLTFQVYLIVVSISSTPSALFTYLPSATAPFHNLHYVISSIIQLILSVPNLHSLHNQYRHLPPESGCGSSSHLLPSWL